MQDSEAAVVVVSTHLVIASEAAASDAQLASLVHAPPIPNVFPSAFSVPLQSPEPHAAGARPKKRAKPEAVNKVIKIPIFFFMRTSEVYPDAEADFMRHRIAQRHQGITGIKAIDKQQLV
jgi:hypothetical protein